MQEANSKGTHFTSQHGNTVYLASNVSKCLFAKTNAGYRIKQEDPPIFGRLVDKFSKWASLVPSTERHI